MQPRKPLAILTACSYWLSLLAFGSPVGYAQTLSASQGHESTLPGAVNRSELGESSGIAPSVSRSAPGSAFSPHAEFSSGLPFPVVRSVSALSGGANLPGNYVGGFFFLSPNIGQLVQNLVIPRGMKAVLDLSTAGSFNLTGDLVNSGKFYAVSSNSAIDAVSISAANIVNQPGGLLSTVLPSGLPGLSNFNSNVSLNLNATNSIVNQGSIVSAANLNLSAGNAIINASVAPNSQNGALIQSAANLSLYAGTGNFVNSGQIQALAGNLNVSSELTKNIVFNNTQGVMSALGGAINFRDSSYLEKADIIVNGGDFIAKVLNFNGGCGTVDVLSNKMEGVVNVVAAETHVAASTNDLVLGTIQISGDPAFYNTAVNGDITIAGPLQFSGQDLAIVAQRNIVTAPGATIIDTSSVLGKGGDITIIAGANVSASSSSGPAAPGQVQPSTPDANDPNITLTISGASGSGGHVDLTGSGTAPISKLSSTSTAARGGNITIAAFSGSDSQSGTVKVPAGVTIASGGAGGDLANSNGNVLIIAGSTSTQALSIGPIDTQNTTGLAAATKTGAVDIVLSQPVLQDGTPMKISGGTVQSGALIGSNSIPSGSVNAGDIAILSEAGMSISSPGSITIGSLISNSGGLLAAGKSITSSSGSINIQTADPSGLGSNMQVVAGAPLSYSCNNCASSTTPGVKVSLNASSPIGGDLDFSASTSFQIDTGSTSGDTNGGRISVVAINSGVNGGSVVLPDNSSLSAAGAGDGLDGNVMVIGAGPNIKLGSLSGNRVEVYAAQADTSTGYPNTLSFDERGAVNREVGPTFSSTVESLSPETGTFANVVINGNVSAKTRFEMVTAGSITFGATSTISGDGLGANSSGASIFLSGSSISIPASISANSSGTGYAGNVIITAFAGDISTGAISANGNFGGTISLQASGGVSTGALSTSGNNAGNISIVARENVNVASVNTSASTGAAGYCVAATGNADNAATLSIGPVNTSGISKGGLVMLVNSSANTASNNLSVGSINTDATGLDGVAGPVSLVASGGIVLSNISAKANANALSTNARGGSVFVSSGGTGVIAIDADSSTIDTSATNSGAGNIAGNIILLTAAASTGSAPSNIDQDSAAFIAAGGTPRSPLVWGINGAAATPPAILNVTASPAINIRPGGYQSQFGTFFTSVPLTLDTGDDTQIVVPINTGASSTGMYLSSITQGSPAGKDNLVLVSASEIQLDNHLSVSPGTNYLFVLTPSSITDLGVPQEFKLNVGHLNLSAGSGIVLENPLSINWSATESLSLFGNVFRVFGTLNSNITLSSANNLIFKYIGSALCCTAEPVLISLSAGGSIAGQNITLSEGKGHVNIAAGSYVSVGKINSSEGFFGSGGGVNISSIDYTSVGDIVAHGDSFGVTTRITSASTITVGNVHAYGLFGSGGNIFLNAAGHISAMNLQGDSGSCCGLSGGDISVNSSAGYLSIESIGASNDNGGQILLNSGTYTRVGDITAIGGKTDTIGSSSISISAGSSISTGEISNWPVSCCNFQTGDVVLSAGSSISYASIRSGLPNNNFAGNVFLTAGTSISGGTIQSSDGSAGNVSIVAANNISIGGIDAQQSSGCAGNCSGGNVVAISTNGNLRINGAILTSSVGGSSGSVSLTAAGAITVPVINTSSGNYAGNVFVSSGSTGSLAVNVGSVDTSSSQSAAGSAGNIFLGANSSGTNGISGTGNAAISFSQLSSKSQSTTPDPYLFFDSSPSSIAADRAINVDYSGTVDIYPGVYVSDIGSSGTPVLLTLDLGGDSRTIVPIVSQGNIYLSGFTADNDGSLASQKNGYASILVSNAGNGITLSGNVSSLKSGSGNNGDVSFYSLAANANTSQTAGSIAGRNLNIFSLSPSTDLGSAGTPLLATVDGVTLVSRDSAGAYLSLTGANVNLSTVTLGGPLEITASGDLRIDTLSSATSIYLQTASGSQSGTGRISTPELTIDASGDVSIFSSIETLGVVSTSGDVVIKNDSAVLTLADSSATSLQITNTEGRIHVTGNLSADSMVLDSRLGFNSAVASSILAVEDLTINAGSAIDIAAGTITLTPGSNGGRGVDLEFNSDTTVRIDGNISSTPYGSIVVNSHSPIPFTIGPGHSSLNGINGILDVSGTGAATTGGTIQIVNHGVAGEGGIVLLDPSYVVLSQPGVVLSVGGHLTLDGNDSPVVINALAGPNVTLSADGAAGGAAGSITVKGSPLVFPSNANLLLSINGNNTVGDFASVSIWNRDSNAAMQVGGGLGQVSISGTGGGKDFSIRSSNDLSVDMSAILFDKPGFRTAIAFQTDGDLLITGDVDVSGTPASSSLHSITIMSASGLPFTIGPGNSSANGITGKLIANGINDAGGSINVASGSGINLLDPSYISVATSGTGIGGQIRLDAAGDDITIGYAEGNKNASNVLTGTLSVDSQGSTSTFSSPEPKIELIAGNVIAGSGNLVLSANGANDFHGGKISVTTFSAPIVIGTGAGEMQAIANFSQTGGTAGQISLVANGNNININESTALSASAPVGFSGTMGTGGSITLSGFSNSVVNLNGGTIRADGAGSGGVGGQISLQVPAINPISNAIFSANGNSKAGSISIVLSGPSSPISIGEGSDQIQISATGGGGTVYLRTNDDVEIIGPKSVLKVADDTVVIYAAHIDYDNGFIDAGNGTLQLSSIISQDISIGGLGSGTAFDISAKELANTNTGTLLIGSTFWTAFGNPQIGNSPSFPIIPIVGYPVQPSILNDGDITIASNLDLSRFGTVVINSMGAFNASGKTIKAPSTHLQVVESGDFNTGTITGGNGTRIDLVQLNRNGEPDFKFNVNGPVTATGSSNVGIYPGGGASLVLSANVGGGAYTFIGVGLNGSLKQTAGVVSGTSVVFQGQSSMGNQPPDTVLYSKEGIININASTFEGIAYGDIYVNNVGIRPLTISGVTVGGSFFLSSNSPIFTTGQVKGTSVVLATNANSNAGITIGHDLVGTLLAVHSNSTNRAVTLSADGSGRIIQTAGAIYGPSILLQTGGGNIGSAVKPISTVSSSDISINIGTGLPGSVFVSNTGNVTLKDSQAGSAFNFTNSGNLTVNHIATGNGAINVISTGGNISVNAGSILNAVEGSLTLQTASFGTINIGAGASLNAASIDPSKGDVLIAAGAVQKIVNAGPPPSNYTSNTLNGGVIYYGNNGISAPTGPNNVVTADTNDVAFFANSSSSQIVLGGGVKISARPVSHYLSSLDLSDPKNVAQIQTLISEGVITGSLEVNGGIATGGSITIPQDILIGGLGIFALKVPENVSVQFTGTWTSGTPLNVNAGVCSTCTQIVQKGNLVFPGNADVVINLGMPNQNGRNNYMDANRISANSLTIYVKMDPTEFSAAPMLQGKANPFFDDPANGDAAVPAPKSQGGFFDFLTPSGCSGEVIAAIKAALTNLANQFNGNGGNAPGSAPTVPVSPFRDKPGRPPGYQIRNVHLGDTRDPNIQGVRIGKDGDVIPVRPFGPLDHISNTTKNGPYDPSTGKPSVETRFPLGIPGDPVVTDSDGRPLINEKTHEPLRPWELKDGPPKPKGFDAFQAAQDGFKFIQNLLGQGY